MKLLKDFFLLAVSLEDVIDLFGTLQERYSDFIVNEIAPGIYSSYFLFFFLLATLKYFYLMNLLR